VPTPTTTETLVPSAVPTTVQVGNQVGFNASGEFFKGNVNVPKRTFVADITNRASTMWTSSNTMVLSPPGPPPMGGIYQGLLMGCACVDASSGGISAPPVSVSVFNPGATPMPCPICATQVPPSPTPTPHAAPIGAEASPQPAASGTSRVGGVLQWVFQAVSPVDSQLAPSPDGNLYFLTLDGNLHNIGAEGRERWSRRATGSSLAVSPDAVVYALGIDGTLVAQQATGRPLWRIDASSRVGPLVASSEAVYFQEDRQLIAAASSSGATKWRAMAPENLTSAALANDGSIVVAAMGGQVAAIATDGTPLWTFAPDGGFSGVVAVRDDAVYVGSMSGRFYALDLSDGAVKWDYNTATAVTAGPALNAEGPIFFGSDAVYALNADGALAWSKPLTNPASGPIVSDGDGGLLVTFDEGISAMVNTDGTFKWATRSLRRIERAAVSPSGILYVASDGTVYAIK
jgi:outer membrane protein assembly factor BamB